ncbi:hypothetical protein [Amycolatopsis sp. 195334CR]|uniref:hypothetical protein n=1 Tax=Amycolatopsis sp. 195334CR TaxID=2814588 RepID=UPI001A8D44DF|nr:hypothetical protein [Amycolatopsis sp. 195334CR]MBN6035100.1 hypothetical protein [Amycolatopsis sp. 195334CR]
MRSTIKLFVLATLATAAGSLLPAEAAQPKFPHPTPGGPAPVAEPDVAGPENIDHLDVTVRPDGGTRDGIEIFYDRTSHTASGEKPAAMRQFVFLFDKSIRFTPEAFPTCDRATFEAGGPAACPPGSKVGSGQADLYPSTVAEVAVFNTKYANGRRGVLITVPAGGLVLENTFEPVVGKYRADYRWGSDELANPSTVPPQDRAATTRFQVSFGATITEGGRTHSFAETSAKPGKPLDFGLWSHFVTGQVALPEDRTIRPW